MTTVLVAVAGKHGATAEIAGEIADVLRHELPAADVEVRDAADVGDLSRFDAVLVGSAIYMGRWLPAARHLVEHHRAPLAALPVWMFSSGPLGDPPRPLDDLAEVTSLAPRSRHAVIRSSPVAWTPPTCGGPNGSPCAPSTPPPATSATTTPSAHGRSRWPRASGRRSPGPSPLARLFQPENPRSHDPRRERRRRTAATDFGAAVRTVSSGASVPESPSSSTSTPC